MSRYIDAKKLFESLRKNCDGCKERGTDYCSTCWCSIAQLLEMIGNAPTADAVERKRGKWVDDGKPVDPDRDSCWCSVCGAWLVGSDEYRVDHNFCPNCGADMREEKTDV